MNWQIQKTGIIDHSDKVLIGLQPIRVLHPMMSFFLQMSDEKFLTELWDLIENEKINPEIDINYEELQIKMVGTPQIDRISGKIKLSETFLSFLWSIIYSLYVLYEETIDFPYQNKVNAEITYPINSENIKSAKALFRYGESLINYYDAWDKEKLPNPERYKAEKRDYVEQTNAIYMESVRCILIHEIIHAKEHLHLLEESTDGDRIRFEVEADNGAIEIMLRKKTGIDEPQKFGHSIAVKIGVIVGILSEFYFRKRTTNKKSPNSEDRLTNALEKLSLSDNDQAWGIACIGLRLWDEQFNLNFEWDEKVDSYKKQYFKVVEQIKNKQKNFR